MREKHGNIYMLDDYGVLYRINGIHNQYYSVVSNEWIDEKDDDIFYYRNRVDYIAEEEALKIIQEGIILKSIKSNISE